MRFAEFRLAEEATSDPKVIELQKLLKSKGYDLGPYGPKGDGIDGTMGPYTLAAQSAFKKGIPPSQAKPPASQDIDKFEKTNKIKPSTGDDIVPTKGTVTGTYGRMVTGPNGNKIPHPGVDIGAPKGTPVVAPQDGKIVFAGNAGSAGLLVELVTASGEKHRVMHLSKISVNRGDIVKKGQELGQVGNTGYSFGNHLHWEKYASNGQQLNPLA